MCGISVYIGRNKNAPDIVFEGLKKLEYRGYDSWGVAAKEKDKISVQKKVGEIGDSKLTLPKTNLAIGHTRWATHGGVTKENAHPHLDCTGQIAVIQNGIIENFQDIKRDLFGRGHKFLSETDTEVIPHLIEENLKNFPFREAVRLAFNKLHGMNAVVVLVKNTDTIIAAKTGSPLVVGFGKDENFLASDITAFIDHTRKVIFMEDGELVEVGSNQVDFYNLASGKKLIKNPEEIDWEFEEADMGKFDHFLIKEIYEQPKIIANIAKSYQNQIEELAKIVRNSFGTYFIGAGTAGNACLLGEYYFAKIAKRHVNFAPASEFRYLEGFLTDKSFVLALTQSGETIDVIEPLEVAKKKGSKIGALVNVLGSTIYRMADFKILLNAGPEKAVLSTKAFTAKASLLLLLAYELDHKYEKGKKQLLEAIKSAEAIFSKVSVDKIKTLANRINTKEHIFVLGRGASNAVALEAALKIKEGTYIHAEAFAGGELKHGVIALIEKGTPVFVFAPNDETYDAIMSNAMEVKARGGYIIGISFKNNDIFDETFLIADCGEASSIPMAIYAQLIAYYLAIGRGINPDRPRNLAKSVTVK